MHTTVTALYRASKFCICVVTCLALGGTTSEAADKAADLRPNILLALADNWAWPHAGACGDKVIRTPVFDKVAADGVLFTHAFCVSPSCAPSRAALLTGQAIHRLEEGANNWGILQIKFATYPDLLKAAGYHVGFMGRGWKPGSLDGSGRTSNPAGLEFTSFNEFLQSVPAGKPFCFWIGHRDPHRSYVLGSGVQAGMKPAEVVVPAYLPDTPEVRGDILDYYVAVQRFDRDTGDALKLLDMSGRARNTLVVMTGDNGWQFPRGLANVYDSGMRIPLAVRWTEQVKGGRTVEDLVTLADFAPTFLEAAGLKPPPAMTAQSLLDLLKGEKGAVRDKVFLERERHANVRAGDLSYPCRAVRTKQFLYIRNLRPDRWPAGDPMMHWSVGPFGDVDGSPTKDVILTRRNEPAISKFFQLAFAKRPAEELYDLAKDPGQVANVADRKEYAVDKRKLRIDLDRWMKDTADPRAGDDDDRWDRYPYFGPPGKKKEPSEKSDK